LIRAARTAVEGETRPHDLGSLLARREPKRVTIRASPPICLANTRHNRQLPAMRAMSSAQICLERPQSSLKHSHKGETREGVALCSLTERSPAPRVHDA